jgi:Domain of Unknown Function (DUF1259)
MLVLAALMKTKKFPFLLSVGLALMLGTSVLAASVSPTAFGQQQQQITNTGGDQNTTGTTTTNNTGTSTAGTLDCQTAASTLGGLVIPNPTGVCDVAVPRQGLQVQDNSSGASLNGLLVINPLFEFLPVSNQTAGGGTTGGNQTTIVYGFAEFALLEEELSLAVRMLSNSSWNIVAVHNHVTMETPKMIFVHAIGTSDITTLTSDAKAVIDSLTTDMKSQQGNQTSTTAGGGGITAGNATNATTTGAGNATNMTTAGNATNMTTAGNATNMTTAGNATNMTTAGNATNMTTGGGTDSGGDEEILGGIL